MRSTWVGWLLLVGCPGKPETGGPLVPVASVSITYVRADYEWGDFLVGFDPSFVPLGEAGIVLADAFAEDGGVVRLLPFGTEPWPEGEVSLGDSSVFEVTPATEHSLQGWELGGLLGLAGELTAIVADDEVEIGGEAEGRLSLYRQLEGRTSPEFADAWWDYASYPLVWGGVGDVVGLDANGDGIDELWTRFGGPELLLCPYDADIVGAQPAPVATDCLLDCLGSPIKTSVVDVDGDGQVELGVTCRSDEQIERALFIDGSAPDGSSIDSVTVSTIVGSERDDWWFDTPLLGVASGDSGVYLAWPSTDPKEPCVGWVTEVPASGVVEAREGAEACAPTGEAGTIDLGGSGAAAHVLLASGTTMWSAPLDGFSGDWTELVDVGEPVIGLRAARGDRVAAILGDGLALIWYDGVRGE